MTTLGPPNRFHPAGFLEQDPSKGELRNRHSERLLRLSLGELGCLLAFDEPTLHDAGKALAAEEFEEFIPRVEADFGAPIRKLNVGKVLQSWWWPMRAQGWGRFEMDLSHRPKGLVLFHVRDVPSTPGTAHQVAALLSGMFAAAFGVLADRELAGAAVPENGEVTLFIANKKTRRAVRESRDSGMSIDEILSSLHAENPK